VVSLVGEAGIWDTPPLAGALAGLSRRRPGLVVIDLADCSMLSSLAIATIIEFYRGVRDRGGVVRLACPSAIVQSVMHTMRLEQLFRTYGSVAEALDPSGDPAA
jgi:anti-anti-sigma factor